MIRYRIYYWQSFNFVDQRKRYSELDYSLQEAKAYIRKLKKEWPKRTGKPAPIFHFETVIENEASK